MTDMLKVIKYFPGDSYHPVKIMGDGPKNDQGVVTSTILRISPTPFGSLLKKDLHGQFFNALTYFGDDIIQKKFGLYEHFMNSSNNPEMGKRPKKDNILGPATLVKMEGDPTRWFDIEVQRALEYHDFLMRLADMKILGASTQAFMNSVEVEEDGYIPVWIENEVGPTVSPANPESIKQIAALKMTKPFISLPPMTVKAWNGDVLEDIIVGNKKDKEVEIVVEEVMETDAPLSEQIEAILEETDAEEPVVGELEVIGVELPTVEQFEELKAELISMKASMSVFIELWGADPDEAREAVAQMMGLAKKIDTMAEGQTETQKALLALARLIKNFKVSEAGKQYQEMTDREKAILEDVEDKRPALKPSKSVAPYGAPGTN